MSDGAESTAEKRARPRVLLRSLAMYLLFVGAPVAGLFGVVRAGRSIEPPPHVGGAWRVADPELARCYGLRAFELEQSGVYLELGAGGRTASARIRDGHIRAEIAASGGLCREHDLTLDATIDEAVLRGVITADGCDACPSLSFRAVRPPPRAVE